MIPVKSNTRFIFVRHGEVDNPKRIIYGQTVDVPLSPKGFLQMRQLASKLQSKSIVPDIIYTSPLLRTLQSAKEILKIFPNTPVIEDDGLKDTYEPFLADKTLDWLKSIDGDEYDQPGVESPESIEIRMMKVIGKIVTKYEERTIFIVSHGDPLAFLVWRLMYKEGDLPRISELNNIGYLKKAEAWKVDLAPNLDVVENEIISIDERLSKDEREY